MAAFDSPQCPQHIVDAARQPTPGGLSARLVYLVAAIHGQGNRDWHCFASLGTLARETQLSRRTVQYRIADLLGVGLLESARHPKGKGLRSKRYVVRAGVDLDPFAEPPRKPFPALAQPSATLACEPLQADPVPLSDGPVNGLLPLSGSCFDESSAAVPEPAAQALDESPVAVDPPSVAAPAGPVASLIPSSHPLPVSPATEAVPAADLHVFEDSLNVGSPVAPVAPSSRLSALPGRAGPPLACSPDVQPVARSAAASSGSSAVSSGASGSSSNVSPPSVQPAAPSVVPSPGSPGVCRPESVSSSTAFVGSVSSVPHPSRLPRLLEAHVGGASPFTDAAHGVLERAGWRFDGACWHGPDCCHTG